MSMQLTQKPNPFFQVRQHSQNHNTNTINCQKMRMSIIDQISPIKGQQQKSTQRDSFYQVKGQSGSAACLLSNKTFPSRFLDSLYTSLNYTQESNVEKKNGTLNKGQKLNFETLKDHFKFVYDYLDDFKQQFDKVIQAQIDQVVQVLKSASQLSNALIEENAQIKSQLSTVDINKFQSHLEQQELKISQINSENNQLKCQINKLQEENQKLKDGILHSEKMQQEAVTKNDKENVISNNNKGKYTQRELSYKFEQAEIKLLTLQISNDQLKQQLQHYQLDQQTISQMKDTISTLELKSQSLLNQKDALQQENDLLNQKVENLEKQCKDKQKTQEFLIYQNSLENELIKFKQEQAQSHQTILSLNNTIQQLKEQINIFRTQKDQAENAFQLELVQSQNELQQATARYQVLWQEISEMKDRLEQRKIEEDSHYMLSNAEKVLFETQITNLNDKIKEYEQILLQNDSKIKSLELQINQIQQEKENYKQQLEKNGSLSSKSLDFQEQQWKITQLNLIINKKDKELSKKSEELAQFKQGYDLQMKKNQNLEGKILQLMEQEIKINSNLIKKP
ncbi:unnamed protein product (macronuclear) [Paramecium tetraurelia]|uniref:Uncharacterized protein n=1 Tax=Paramecium tetraurelia TaxID=5888 RepID=A0DWA1_PARTE|nr:uncharacterized protein GSPATT00020960001 [Paramecium tetraurelia]CAK87318.1 unnamed protein product [Paramecium tetraurelia]|eukprot:XP_001454715.1 hypothetical protein (macronuclear) [Paramecium tetraurelia strain d4-2]